MPLPGVPQPDYEAVFAAVPGNFLLLAQRDLSLTGTPFLQKPLTLEALATARAGSLQTLA